MSELEILHGWRRALLREKRRGGTDWSEAELAYVRKRIDELRLAELGLRRWRDRLVWELKARLIRLLLDSPDFWANLRAQ
jgi:hypothetical protein